MPGACLVAVLEATAPAMFGLALWSFPFHAAPLNRLQDRGFLAVLHQVLMWKSLQAEAQAGVGDGVRAWVALLWV